MTNNPTDRDQLVPMSQHAQQALNKREITVLLDRGYYNASFKVAYETGIEAIVPKTHTSGNHSKGLFTKEDFAL